MANWVRTSFNSAPSSGNCYEEDLIKPATGASYWRSCTFEPSRLVLRWTLTFWDSLWSNAVFLRVGKDEGAHQWLCTLHIWAWPLDPSPGDFSTWRHHRNCSSLWWYFVLTAQPSCYLALWHNRTDNVQLNIGGPSFIIFWCPKFSWSASPRSQLYTRSCH